jgi:hypothetical protein
LQFELLTEILWSYCGKMDLTIEIPSPHAVSLHCNDHPMSKVLLLPNPILTTSLIYPIVVTGNCIQSPYITISTPPMRNFFLEREGQQLCPYCHAFMHIFAPYIPLGGWWHELIWRLSLHKLCFHGNYPGCLTTLFFCCYWMADVPIGV